MNKDHTMQQNQSSNLSKFSQWNFDASLTVCHNCKLRGQLNYER